MSKQAKRARFYHQQRAGGVVFKFHSMGSVRALGKSRLPRLLVIHPSAEELKGSFDEVWFDEAKEVTPEQWGSVRGYSTVKIGMDLGTAE